MNHLPLIIVDVLCFQFYYSRYSIAFAVTLTIGLAVTPKSAHLISLYLTLSMLLYLVGAAFVWNYAVLRYAFQHSFNLYIICITCIFQVICQWIFKAVHDDLYDGLFARICLHLAIIVAFPLLYTQNGLRLHHRAKQIVIFVVALSTFWVTVQYVLFGPYPEYEDVVIHTPTLDIDISLESLMLIGQWNISVFWFQKFMLITLHPNCILIASYPQIIWMNSGSINTVMNSIRGFEPNSVGHDRASLQRSERISSMSVNIYEQSVSQKANVYLMEDNSIAHIICRMKAAKRVHHIHFSKMTVPLFVSLFLLTMWGIRNGIHTLTVILQILLVGVLLIGLFTFDVEMMRFYMKSFDFWFKAFYWALFSAADGTLNGLEKANEEDIEWIAYMFRKCIFTVLVFYVICIDAYHVSQRFKKAASVISLMLAVYCQVCIALQVNAFSPQEKWDDHNIVISKMGIELSLRSTMMNSLGNFIMFMTKQLVILFMHPGTAAFQLYPKIEWTEDQESWNEENAVQQA